MTEFDRLLPMAPVLREIDTLLGGAVTPDQKVALFRLVQRVAGEAIRRTISDLSGRTTAT